MHFKDLELSLCDTQKGAVWGLNGEFLSSPRLDNQVRKTTTINTFVTNTNAKLTKRFVKNQATLETLRLSHNKLGLNKFGLNNERILKFIKDQL